MSGNSASSSKSGKASACPAETGVSCLSDARKADLLADFGIAIDNDDASGYTKKENAFIQSIGVQAPEDNRLLIGGPLEEFNNGNEAYRIPISMFKCIDEAYALAASACDKNALCVNFSVNQIPLFGAGEGSYTIQLRFFGAQSVLRSIDGTALQQSASLPGFPSVPQGSRVFTGFIGNGQSDPQDISACQVPPFTQAELAFTCLGVFQNDGGASLPPGTVLAAFNSGCCDANAGNDCSASVNAFNAAGNSTFTQADYCDCGPTIGGPLGGGSLVTNDFIQFIAPSADCLGLDNLGPCLACASNFVTLFGSRGKDTCGGSLICEPDDALNFITAMPCEDGIQTDDCVCDACGDVCLGSTCKESIQTALICQGGSPAETVLDPETDEFVDSGSCFNSLDGTDFSCPSSD